MSRSIATYLGLALVFFALALVGRDAMGASYPPLTTKGGVVASDHEEASRVGARVLARGGNAADAAVATALALGVINPASSGLGGGGFAVLYDAAKGELHAIDFREQAPAALTPDKFVVDGALHPELARAGGLAVGVPGEPAGLEYLSGHYGTLPWAQMVEPARRLAAGGFAVGWFLARAAAAMVERLPADHPLVRWLSPKGILIRRGRRVRRSALGRTLAAMQTQGASVFYRGPIAKDLLDTVRGAGGVMTLDDLANYRVLERDPVVGTWRGRRIASMPLPSSGGLVLLELCGILDQTGVHLRDLGAGSSAAFHLLAEVLKHGFADRARFMGDARPAALSQKLLDKARLRRLARRIRMSRVRPHRLYGDQKLGAGHPAPPDDDGTSHICVIDAAGNAVALTTTVNGYFGANLIAPKSGVVLNNEMDDFSLQSGVPNQFGLVQSDANLVGPGKRPLSSMTPTLVLQDRRVVACLGGSGGPRIISSVFQVLLNLFVFDMNASAAVSAPRIHHQWTPNKLLVEPQIPADVLEGLKRRGHKLETARSIASVQAIRVREDGTRAAASDPRKGGRPAAPR